MPPLRAGGLAAGVLCVVGGAAIGALTRLADVAPPLRAAAAVTAVLGAATCVAAAVGASSPGWRGAGRAAGLAAGAALAAGVVAGEFSVGAALVVGGVAALAAGLGGLLRRCGPAPGVAAFAAALLASAPTALLFVADPFIEWTGGKAGSEARAQAVVAVNPVGAICGGPQGVGVDWLRQPILYDGPATGVHGLSVIGQYYGGATPAGAFVYAAAAAGIGFLLAFAAGRRVTMRP